jgi:multiple sugar transport system ATP-binding protein
VAMGRAIVRRPAVYLMDEPLSNLDAKLRVQTRTELAELQARLAVTTVYVTHDQVEAMTMGHRVAVLKDGVLQQCDAPGTLYHEPANLFVAGFIGSPAMNLVAASTRDGAPILSGAAISYDAEAAAHLRSAIGDRDGAVVVGFRPEAVHIGDGPVNGRIRTVEDLGSEVFVHIIVTHEDGTIPLVAKVPAPFAGKAGETVALSVAGTVHAFDTSGSRLVTGLARTNSAS